jgi:serine/threonine protein kinase
VTPSAAAASTDLASATFVLGERTFVCGDVPTGENRGLTYTVAQPLAGRYQILRFFASGGTGLLLEGCDLRTSARVLIKSVLRYDVLPYARYSDKDGFTNQLRAPRKTLEMERRILVLLRNGGCNNVPHPNDFVFDSNPQLRGPFPTEDGPEWTYDDDTMIDSEPYLIMEAVSGRSLEQALAAEPQGRFSEERSLHMLRQAAGVLRVLHEEREMRPGMTWRLIYQDLKPSNLLLAEHDRITVIDLGGCQLINLATGQKLLQGVCTPGYCPPECEQPYSLLTPAADVYTVGSTLFHLLTGRSPLEFLAAGLPLGQARAVRLDLGLVADKCRPATQQFLQRCLAPDPVARFPDMASVQEELQQLLKENEPQASASGA